MCSLHFRWGFSVHGCIDGFSRLITFLKCSNDNLSSTVLQQFLLACQRYGLPSRVRSDHGKENLQVALFINIVRGRKSHITGRSVHNQRIERLWRDVRTQVVEVYRNTFYEMEEDPAINLEPENENHQFALNLVFQPLINERLEEFRLAWNNHKIRSEGNMSPNQLWLSGSLDNSGANYAAQQELFGDGRNLETSLENGLQRYGVSLNDVDIPDEQPNEEHELLNGEQKEQLMTEIMHLPARQKFVRVISKLRELGIN